MTVMDVMIYVGNQGGFGQADKLLASFSEELSVDILDCSIRNS